MRQQYSSGMTRRDFIKNAAMVSAGISAIGSIDCFAEPGDQKPNILYLMTDQQRGDCIGCAGNPVIKTPNILFAGKSLFIINSSTCTRS